MSPIPIGTLRGVPSTDINSFDVIPAFKGKSVLVQGVIHQRILWKSSKSDRPQHAFLIQNILSDSDQNSRTSDGLFIYSGKKSIPLYRASGKYEPKVGDLIQLLGVVGHRYGQTELTKPQLVKVMQRNINIASVLPRIELGAILQHDLNRSLKKYESMEGMRVVLKSGAVVQSPRHYVGMGQDAFIWVLPSEHPVSRRKEIFQNRTFRDAHPLDDLALQGFDNNNGARILISSLGIKGRTQNLSLDLPAAKTGDKLSPELSGGIVYSYSQYKFMTVEQPFLQPGVDPVNNLIPEPPLQDDEVYFRVVTYNLENLYDYRNDPSDPCDDSRDKGTENIKPPFNYLPSKESEYRHRLKVFASQIIHDMKSPDLLLVQEIEDQDILSFSNSVIGREKRLSDGYPDVLQELSQIIRLNGGPSYQGVSNRSGADERGISCAFLCRKDRVHLKELGDISPWIGSVRNVFTRVKTFGNSNKAMPIAIQAAVPGSKGRFEKIYPRPSQLARFQIVSAGGVQEIKKTELFVLNNHFSSRPQERVSLRRYQAKLASTLAASILKVFPDAGFLVAGDLNVFPRPDDPHPEMPSDQLGSLYESGMLSAYDWILSRQPANAYSYVYQGQAQTLDHCFLSKSLHQRLVHANFLHINADWPEYREFPMNSLTGHRVSDHDPLALIFHF